MSPDSRDYRLATLMRIDPERLAALRRAMTGKTRCPECDESNPADQRRCAKCGASLYPDLDAEEREKKKEETTEG